MSETVGTISAHIERLNHIAYGDIAKDGPYHIKPVLIQRKMIAKDILKTDFNEKEFKLGLKALKECDKQLCTILNININK